MSQYYSLPSASASANPSVGTNGQNPAPTSSTEISGINPSGALQPVSVDASGNVNTNVISSALPTGAATAANQATEITNLGTIATNTTRLAQGSTTSGQTGQLIMGAVTTAQPTYTTGTTAPLSLSTAGGVRAAANISQYGGTNVTIGQQLSAASVGVVIASDQSAVPVSGTVTANAGTGNFTVVQAVAGNLNASVVGTGTAGVPSGGVLSVQGVASGTAIPISAASLPIPTGAATSALQTTGNTSLATIATNTAGTAQGASSTGVSGGMEMAVATTAAPSYTTGTVNPLSSNLSGGLRVDGSGVTQPISAASLPLPALAATSTLQTSGGQKTQVVDASGNTAGTMTLSSGAVVGTNALAVAQSGTNFVNSSVNSSSVQLAASATFTGTVENAYAQQSFSLLMTSDQPITLTIYQYLDSGGTQLAQSNVFTVAANAGFARSYPINGNYVKVSAQNTGASTTTTFNLSTTYGTIPSANALGNAPVSISDVNGVAISGSSLPVTQGGFVSSNAPVYNAYSSTPISTSTYVQLVASTTSATKFVDIFDSSGQAMILATGAPGSEVIQAYVPPGGDAFSFAIPAGTRVAYKALTANASSGYLLLNLRG